MSTLTVTLEFPRDLLGALDIPASEVEDELRELIALALFREGRVSSGKAAELLGISKLDFVQLLAQHEIPYFTESPAELIDDVARLDQLLDAEHR
jgi:predicted HTH domain antitoxin